MALGPGNALQAKTGSATSATTASVTLDTGATAGNTVTIELWAGGVPITDGGLGGVVPDGFETDAISEVGTKQLYVFRKRGVTGGEGFTGGTPASWDFGFVAANQWAWRVTEWDGGLEPVSPLEAAVSNWVDNAPATLSTGTTAATSRVDVVGLACHLWFRTPGNGTQATWSAHTNGFVERDQLRSDFTASMGISLSWSWVFSAPTGTFECTASRSVGNASTDDEYALLVVYAATTYGVP